MGGCKEDGARFFSLVPSERTRGSGHQQLQEIPFKQKKKLFYCDSGQTLEQVTQRGCEASTFGVTQTPTRHSPEKPALVDPALSREGWTREIPAVLSNLNYLETL